MATRSWNGYIKTNTSCGVIAIDYGTVNPMVYLDIYDDGTDIYVVREYYWDSRKEEREKDNSQYADDLMGVL